MVVVAAAAPLLFFNLCTTFENASTDDVVYKMANDFLCEDVVRDEVSGAERENQISTRYLF